MIVSRTLVRVLCLGVAAAAAAAIAAVPRAHAAAEASFTVVANQGAANGGQNFNGVAKGRLIITVAPGTPVHLKFVNDKTAALPHSLQVIPLNGSAQSPVLPAQAAPRAAFPGAETPNAGIPGTAPGKTVDVRFTASKAGHYLFICGYPGHALLGMYGTFNVTPGAKPSMTVAK
jgi:FtsP/CotA-like multicopper oxidase with cupredoxin domain